MGSAFKPAFRPAPRRTIGSWMADNSSYVPSPRPPLPRLASAALKIAEVNLADGPVATKGKLVKLHYTAYVPDGTAFDSTTNRQPLQFQLGLGTVLKGWDLGVEGMKVGGKRKLTVPPALAIGDRAVGQIKPNSTLVFDVELVAVP
jgi:FKBP-type peptidyl-prolyl cis-trans isomerase FkpA